MNRRPRIAVFGSVHIDLIAHAVRLPDTGTSGIAHGFSMALGGKGGHQAIQCRLAGADTKMIAQLGDDAFGQDLLKRLTIEGVDCTHVSLTKSGKTGVSTVLSAPDGYTSLIYPGAAAELTEDDVADCIRKALPFDLLILQLELPSQLSVAAARIARDAGARIVLNAAPPVQQIGALLALADILIVNEAEAEAINSSKSVLELAKKLKLLTVMTKGARGSSASDGLTTWSHEAMIVEASSTVGAGDAFLAGFCVSFGADGDVPSALKAATEAATRKLRSKSQS
jgi:ribokinase